MRLLYAKNITFDELPHIECAILAVSKVKSMYRELFPGIINLGNMLTDCGRPGNKSEDVRRWQLARLIERIKSYEVMLVLNYYEKPMIPLFTLQADASHPRGGTWQVTDRRDLGASRLAILLRNMRPSHRSLVQAARAEQAAAAAAAAVVKAVTEEKRYPLTAALAYQHPGADKNTLASLRCKLENEFTGPESRRSGEIKTTDPVYSELRRRELLAGDYTLSFTRPPLDPRALKTARTKA